MEHQLQQPPTSVQAQTQYRLPLQSQILENLINGLKNLKPKYPLIGQMSFHLSKIALSNLKKILALEGDGINDIPSSLLEYVAINSGWLRAEGLSIDVLQGIQEKWKRENNDSPDSIQKKLLIQYYIELRHGKFENLKKLNEVCVSVKDKPGIYSSKKYVRFEELIPQLNNTSVFMDKVNMELEHILSTYKPEDEQ